MENKKNDTLIEESLVTDTPETYKLLSVTEQGRNYQTTFTKKFENRTQWASPNPEEIKSYIPGTVDKIGVKAGDYVKKNAELMTYMAMKMKNVIRAPFNGTVEAIHVKAGDQLPKGELMLTLKAGTEEPKKKKKQVKKVIRHIKRKKKKKALLEG
jgi:biotin carboxyl carrier protein